MNHCIQFEFICSQPVALYGHLCHQYVDRKAIDIRAAQFTDEQHNTHYLLEAFAEQAQLEQLAEEIAEDFLLSVWLIDTRIQRVEHKQYPQSSLSLTKPTPYAPLPYCQHCQPLFGDNQSQQFANINLACSHCHGETKLSVAQKSLSEQDIFAFADLLLNNSTLHLPDDNMTLSLALPLSAKDRPSIIVCNPNDLNGYFHLSDHQVLALSSIEKPCITLMTNDTGKAHFKTALVDVQFASNRLLVILTEKLRQRGINWLYSHSNPPGEHHGNPPLKLARLAEQWIAKQQVKAGQCEVLFNPLHDEAISQIANINYCATSIDKQVSWSAIHTEHKQVLPESHAAQCALLAGLQTMSPPNPCKKAKHAAILFFSYYQASQILALDKEGNAELFFEMANIPNSGYEICHQLSQSRESGLLDKFKQMYPDSYNALLDIELTSHTKSLTSLMAVAAAIIGCRVYHDAPESITQQLADSFIADAMGFNGANAPRIDFPLTKGEAYRSLNWCKTLGTLMSFRIAGETDTSKLAFAFHDSLADYLSNWIEHLDKNIGIKHLVLAGSEFDNPVLAKRIQMRVGKNTPLVINKQLDLEGANLAVGGIFLRQRRR
ncbi:NiFe hydrogenase [Shewanella aestuarii]|uniref:NiFe hydrogenase n=1 Tax=Shewanella aestuarii TaxID=1028752 RepID=A0A6G9QMW5_9GAMM|nr:NiFe hydrogenase [Shewanella aestuarii]QIR15397.1 NiFe hydrogenase [Shewanella aestuarii]